MLFLFSQHWNVKQLVVARAQWKKKEYGDFVMDVALLAFVSLSLSIYTYIYIFLLQFCACWCFFGKKQQLCNK